jgi:hypothetical protein
VGDHRMVQTGRRVLQGRKRKRKIGRGYRRRHLHGQNRKERKDEGKDCLCWLTAYSHSLFLSAFGSLGLLFLNITNKIRIQTSNNTALLLWRKTGGDREIRVTPTTPQHDTQCTPNLPNLPNLRTRHKCQQTQQESPVTQTHTRMAADRRSRLLLSAKCSHPSIHKGQPMDVSSKTPLSLLPHNQMEKSQKSRRPLSVRRGETYMLCMYLYVGAGLISTRHST